MPINNDNLNEVQQTEEKGERLHKVIAQSGFCSRRAAEELILAGRVKVNGKIADIQGIKVVQGKDKIYIDNRLLALGREFIYILLYKPSGYICSANDEKGRRTVLDLLSGIDERIYPVGRLDYSTSGALLLTNDGELTNKLLHPARKVDKTYRTEIDGDISEKEADMLRKGIRLEDGITSPADVKIVRRKDNKTTLEITIHEGRNRQVRRMMTAVGHECNWLKRTAFAGIGVENLRLGEWRHLTAAEVDRLKRLP